MKRETKLQRWIPSALVGLALAASTTLGLAGDISYTFNTDVQGWYPADGHGSIVWDGTHNRGGGGGGGCLKCTIVAGTDTEVDPRIDLAFDTTTAFSVEFDMMVDAASGTDTGGNYGNLQVADLNANWNWHSEWYGGLGGSGGKFSTWRHVSIPFAATYGPRAHLAIQIATGAGPYSADVIVYIDNIVIRDGTPPNKAVLIDFAWPEECVPDNSWGAVSRAWSQDTTLHSDGSLKEVVDYGSGNTGWQDVPGEFHNFPAPYDISKFTYVDFDLYLDAPTGLPSYGQYELASWYGWSDMAYTPLSAANIGKWTHYSFALPASVGNCQGLVFHPGGNNLSGIFTYYIDNIAFWKPSNPPTIRKLVKGSGIGGVQITMDSDGAAYQREGFTTPSGGGPYLWPAQGSYPVSYSFTITNFPDAVVHHGFEAHLYLANDSSGWDQTYGSIDWNATNILEFRVENAAAGGVIARIDWKTNLPGANPLPDVLYHPVYAQGPTALGTWTLTFTDETNGTVTGPGLTATNFTLPPEAVANFTAAAGEDSIQFGMFKNDGANDGRNNQAHGTFSEVQMTVNGGTVFDDTFPGPDLQGSGIFWRKTTSSGGATAVQWVPPDIAWWLTWTLPDDNFGMKVAGNINGPYDDAGITFTYTQGAIKIGGVPAATMPAGDAAFFQMINSNYQSYATEMTQLDISGGTLPAGVMLRESPSKSSLGKTLISAPPAGGYDISSFFDVWVEISLDDGATWSAPTNGPAHMSTSGHFDVDTLPPQQPYVSPAAWHAAFKNGIVIKNIIHTTFLNAFPPPPWGAGQAHAFGSTVLGDVSVNGGLTFNGFSAGGNVGVTIRRQYNN
jgi:hypothetical protein